MTTGNAELDQCIVKVLHLRTVCTAPVEAMSAACAELAGALGCFPPEPPDAGAADALGTACQAYLDCLAGKGVEPCCTWGEECTGPVECQSASPPNDQTAQVLATLDAHGSTMLVLLCGSVDAAGQIAQVFGSVVDCLVSIDPDDLTGGQRQCWDAVGAEVSSSTSLSMRWSAWTNTFFEQLQGACGGSVP